MRHMGSLALRKVCMSEVKIHFRFVGLNCFSVFLPELPIVIEATINNSVVLLVYLIYWNPFGVKRIVTTYCLQL